MSGYISLAESNSIGKGAQSLSEEAEVMYHQVTMLIADMEGIPRALVGQTGNTFEGTAEALQERFHELMEWCSNNGIKLGESQEMVSTTELNSTELLDHTNNTVSSLARNVNG